MLISYIIPTRNRAYLIERMIDSILRQPYPYKEIIIVNDASTDNLVEIVTTKYGKNNIVKLINFVEHKGQNKARNVGINSSKGEIITIIDSDDEDFGTNLQCIIDCFKTEVDLSGVFTPAVSRTTGRLMAKDKFSDCYFDFKGFIDGTYEGEYQFFLKKSILPEMVFEENLPVKRSCTLLTWLKLGRDGKFIIKKFKTRLYNDDGADRLGDADSLYNDAEELIYYYDLIEQKHGMEIKKYSSKAYSKNIASKVFYLLSARGRAAAFKESLKLFPLCIIKFIILNIMILGGSKMALYIKRVKHKVPALIGGTR